jgi:hypothetical protein
MDQANPPGGHISPLGELFNRATLLPPAPFPRSGKHSMML